MQRTRFLAAAAIAASLTVSACNSEPELVTVNKYDPMAEQLKKAGPVELPPSIAESRTYRCADNSLVYVDFFTNNTARLRAGSRDADPVMLNAGEGGTPPYTAEGHSVSANSDNTQITVPGRGSQSCHT
jgi:hypothetical protein